MRLAAYIVWFFAAFTLVGGIIGMVKAGSSASLIAGGVSAVLLALCGVGLNCGNTAAGWAAVGLSLILAIRFWGKWFGNHRVMPELVMGILSVLVIAAVIMAILTRNGAKT